MGKGGRKTKKRHMRENKAKLNGAPVMECTLVGEGESGNELV